MINDRISDMIADIFKSLAHPARVKILLILKDKPLSVSNIMDALGMEQSNTSQHLNVLKSEGLVESRKEGLNVIYSVKAHYVFDLIECSGRILLQGLEETRRQLETNQSTENIPDKPAAKKSYLTKYGIKY